MNCIHSLSCNQPVSYVNQDALNRLLSHRTHKAALKTFLRGNQSQFKQEASSLTPVQWAQQNTLWSLKHHIPPKHDDGLFLLLILFLGFPRFPPYLPSLSLPLSSRRIHFNSMQFRFWQPWHYLTGSEIMYIIMSFQTLINLLPQGTQRGDMTAVWWEDPHL